MRFHFSLASCLALVALPATSIAQDVIDWKVGTRFAYVQRDLWNKEIDRWTESVLRKDGESWVVEYQGTTTRTEFAVTPAGLHTRPMPGASGSFSYQLVKLPLTEGTEWEYRYHYIGSNMNLPAHVNRQCKAGKLEDVEVPAGKFKARKFECKGSWVSSAGSSGTAKKTVWFAPELGVVVKSNDISQYFGGRDQSSFALESIAKP